MKKIITPIIFVVLIAAILPYMGCKETDAVEVYLTVHVLDGVTGTPEEGTYIYEVGSEVEYNYTLLDGYSGLRVTLDETEIETSGTITIEDNHVLEAFSSQGTGQYQVIVSRGTGTTGTPESGYYYYDAGDQIDYSYELEDGYTNLVVAIDGETVSNTGTLTVSGDHTLYAYAEIEYEVQGTWTLEESYADNSEFTVTVTFTGEIESGIVEDSDGGVGTYAVSGNEITFTLEYPEVTYEYTGTFTTDEDMSGTSSRITSENAYSGEWSAEKDTGEEESMRRSGRKGKI